MSTADLLNDTAIAHVVYELVSVTLPMPPSVNSCWRNVRGIGRVRTAAYRKWSEATGWTLRVRCVPSFHGRVAVTIRAGNPARRRDLDNLAKPILDALVENRVIEDDSNPFLRKLNMEWDPTIEAEQVLVTVRAI